MKAKDRLEETKIRMLMKLKKLNLDTNTKKTVCEKGNTATIVIGRKDDLCPTPEDFFSEKGVM